MYDDFKLCDTLKPSEICIVVEQYRQGPFVRLYHQHIPKSRTSHDDRIQLLRTLVMHFEGYGPDKIVRSFLNNRRGDPPRNRGLDITFRHSEPGANRYYCGTDTKAWFDIVIDPKQFRSPR